MSPSDQIAKLERLLERVQKNAGSPRAAKAFEAPAAAPAPLPTPPPPSEDEAPIPLVAVAPRAAEEVSSVQVSADAPVLEVRAERLSEPAEELSEEDLVEINSVPPPPVFAEAAPVPEPPAPSDDIDFEDEEEAEEKPPASSKRSKVPTTMDEALAAAAAQHGGEDREIPIKTPPPESGPQEAVPLPAGLSPAPLPDVDDLLEAELPPPRGPRPEQLGQTIELEEARGPALELDLGRKPTPVPVQEASELEAALPPREPEGDYAAAPPPPPPPEASQDQQAFVRPAPPEGEVASFVAPAAGFQPKSFIELVDASIALGKS